ncbi:MAG: YrhB domain-containing protein [Ilumatobacteraceae bacterium]
MSLESALVLVLRFMVEVLGDDANEPRYAIVGAELRDEGWLFEFTSSAFLRTRSFLDALGGNRPLLVRADGKVIELAEPRDAGEAVCPRAS